MDNINKIESYLQKCSEHLCQSMAGKYTLDRLSLQHWTHPDISYIPSDVGMVLQDEVPELLSELRKKQYKEALICKYTNNNELTGIKIINPDMSSGPYIELSDKKGSFLESHITDPNTLIIVPDELSALSIYTRSKTRSPQALPVILPNALPLSNRFNNVTDIYLITSENRPLNLTTALQYLGSPIITDVPVGRLNAHVIELKQDINHYETNALFNLTHKQSPILSSWIVNQLIFTYNVHGISSIYTTLMNVTLPEEVKERLITKLKQENAEDKLISLIASNNSLIPESRALFNNRTVMRTPAGFVGCVNGTHIPLSNTTFKIKNKILTSNKEVYCNCILQTGTLAPIHANINYESFKLHTTLKTAVQAAYMEHNLTPPIAFYKERYFDWQEICDIFSDSIQAQREITTLGVDDILSLQLPNYTINTNGTITNQIRLFDIPKDVITQYTGLASESYNLDVFKELWSQDNAYTKAFTLAISHILYHILLPRFIKNSESHLHPKHLCFINSNEDRLNPVIHQLSLLFTNNDYAYKLPHAGALKRLREFNRLGTLPLICIPPTVNNKHLVKLFEETPINLITSVTEEQAFALNRVNNISFMIDPPAEQFEPNITTTHIKQLQDAFIPFLSKLMLYHIKDKMELLSAMTPASMMHSIISIILNIPVNETLHTILQPYYIDSMLDLDILFLNCLSKFVYANDTMYKPVIIQGEPTKQLFNDCYLDPKIIIVTEKAVFIRVKLITLMNRLYANGLHAIGVRAQLKQSGVLLDNKAYAKLLPNSVHYIVLRREVWDDRIVKKQILKLAPQPILSVA